MNNVSVVATLLVVVFFQVGPGAKQCFYYFLVSIQIFSSITIIFVFQFREQPGGKTDIFSQLWYIRDQLRYEDRKAGT